MAQAQVWPLWENSTARARGASGKKCAMGTSVQIQQLKAIEAMHTLALQVLPVPTFQLWLCPKFTVCPWSCHLTPLHSLHWLQSSTRRSPGRRALLHWFHVLLYLPRMDNIPKHHFLLHFQATTLGRPRTPWGEHRMVTSSPGTQLTEVSVSSHALHPSVNLNNGFFQSWPTNSDKSYHLPTCPTKCISSHFTSLGCYNSISVFHSWTFLFQLNPSQLLSTSFYIKLIISMLCAASPHYHLQPSFELKV